MQNRKRLSELYGDFCWLQGRPEADVLYFTCPSCAARGLHAHGIMVSWTPPSLFPSGAVWTKTGTTIEDITIAPSINCDVPHEEKQPDGTVKTVPSECKFHGFVQNGWVIW